MDEPLAWYEGAGLGDRRTLFGDHQGSIIAAGAEAYAYSAYGEPKDGVWTGSRFRYIGQIALPEARLYHYKARVYDPKLGRFLQTDPVGYEDQMNMYAYVANDPVNATDPTGEFIDTVADVIFIGLDVADIAQNGLNAENRASLAANVAGALIPGATGLGIGARAAVKGSGQSRRTAKTVAKTCCFVAGTLVETETGLRPIETIKVGEKVWARDIKSGVTALKPVTDLIRRHQRVIWEVRLTGLDGATERFETTDDHPWWIAGQGWKTTEELSVGMAVVTRDGRGMIIAAVVETNRVDGTYNLTVADFETYFVGDDRVLVHNCPASGGRSPEAQARAQANEARGIPSTQLGGSGKPKQHTVQHSTTKSAREAAERDGRREGGGARFDAHPQDGQKPRYQGETADGANTHPVRHHCPPDKRC